MTGDRTDPFRDWGRYRGLYHHGQRTILSYSVGGAEILELPGQMRNDDGTPIFTRQLSIGPAAHDLSLRVAPEGTHVLVRGNENAEIDERDGFVVVNISSREVPINVEVLVCAKRSASTKTVCRSLPI